MQVVSDSSIVVLYINEQKNASSYSFALWFENLVESQAFSGGWITYTGLAFVSTLQSGIEF